MTIFILFKNYYIIQMELKIRSKSTIPTYTNNNRNLLDAPKHMFKLADISLSPFNLKAKGRKDLKKNKNKILVLSNSTYLSCPEMDDNDSLSSSTKNSPSRDKIGYFTTKLVHNKDDYYELRAVDKDYTLSENKKMSKLSVRLLSNNDNSYKNIQDELNIFLKGFSYDTTNIKQTYNKLDIEEDYIHEKNPKTDFPKYKESIPINKFDLDPEEDSQNLTAYKHRSSCFESRVRSISSILSKLGYAKGDSKEDSD